MMPKTKSKQELYADRFRIDALITFLARKIRNNIKPPNGGNDFCLRYFSLPITILFELYNATVTQLIADYCRHEVVIKPTKTTRSSVTRHLPLKKNHPCFKIHSHEHNINRMHGTNILKCTKVFLF